MVYFTCNACGQSLKKNQVEKHYTTQCRKCEVLSCVDCGKDFWGDDYKTHIKCITEEEKYSGPNYKPKSGANKGEKKQAEWIQNIQNAAATIQDDPELRSLLQLLVTFSNIPQKQMKFEKFIRNSVNVKNQDLVHKAWNVFRSAHKPSNETNATANAQQSATTKDEDKEKSAAAVETTKGKKRKLKELESDDVKPSSIDKVNEKHLKRKDMENEETNDLELGSSGKKSKKKKQKQVENEGEIVPVQDTDDVQRSKNKKKSKKERKVEDIGDKFLTQENDVALANGVEKKSKGKHRDVGTENEDKNCFLEDTQHEQTKFRWTRIAASILKEKPQCEMKLKKLKKKLLIQYKSLYGEHVNEADVYEKIECALLNKTKKFKLANEKIQLL